MDKAAALEFIGLKEPLTEESVLTKYTERFNYYHMLYSNAPSKVIEKIQQQNLEKLNQVKRVLLDDIRTKRDAFNERFRGPVEAPKPEPKAAADADKPVAGWLIVRTENRKIETFDLYEGVNFIGRKEKKEGAGSIVIGDDPFISRTHAFIKIRRADGELQFVLYDGDGSKPSANGVFLNGNEIRINQHCALQENDTFQVGTTKLVLKIRKENRSISGEIEEILKTDFIRTIDINK